MASTIITKNSSTASAVPVVGDLTKGELAVNVTDKKIYTKDNSAAVVKLVGSLGNQEANAVAITGGSIAGITDLAVADGGTGASTASDARTNLGLGTIATQAASSVTITGGSVTGITDITVADGGTGASTAANARSNLGAAASGANSDITSLSGLTTALSVAQGGTGITSFGSGVATFLGTPSSANLLAAVTDETGTGSLVFATSPTLVTPALGTPSALVGTNITGTASGLTAGNVTTNANLTGAVTSVGNASSLGSFTSAQLAGALTDETGTGSAVFATSPTLVTPILGTPTSATLTNATGLPIATGVSGLGTGVATALAVNVGSAGAPVVNGGALGTPSSGTVTNLTGTASININGTVGATTPTTGAFTTLSASSSVTLSGGTANGVTYLNGSKVLTSGSALTFDGTNLKLGTVAPSAYSGYTVAAIAGTNGGVLQLGNTAGTNTFEMATASGETVIKTVSNTPMWFGINNTETLRLTSTSLYTASGINVAIGNSNPQSQLHIYLAGTATARLQGNRGADGQVAVLNFSNRTDITGGYIIGAISVNRIGDDNSGEMLFSTAVGASTPTERAKITSDGFFKLQKGLSVGGATPANGAGLTFPSTQDPSSSANCLDDYEEGTWEPNQGAGLTVVGTYSSSGTYTKIGRVVTIRTKQAGSTSIVASAVGLLCTNLPFASAAVFDGVIGSATNNSYDVFVGTTNTGGGSLYYATSAIAATPAIWTVATYTV